MVGGGGDEIYDTIYILMETDRYFDSNFEIVFMVFNENVFMVFNENTCKPAREVTSIKGSPVLSSPHFQFP